MRSRRASTLVLAAVLATLAAPAAASAHSELVTSSPAGGTTLEAPPTEIVGDFSEAVDPGRSSMELRGPGGDVLAKGGVPDGGPPTRMVVGGLATLAPGAYEVRWTTVTADDGGVERGTFTFVVAAGTPPVPGGSPAATAAESPAAPLAATPDASASATSAPSASRAVSPPGAPTPAPTPAAAGDVLIPVVALAAILVAGVAWLLLRGR